MIGVVLAVYALIGLLTLLGAVLQHTFAGFDIEADWISVIVVFLVITAWPWAWWIIYRGMKPVT